MIQLSEATKIRYFQLLRLFSENLNTKSRPHGTSTLPIPTYSYNEKRDSLCIIQIVCYKSFPVKLVFILSKL